MADGVQDTADASAQVAMVQQPHKQNGQTNTYDRKDQIEILKGKVTVDMYQLFLPEMNKPFQQGRGNTRSHPDHHGDEQQEISFADMPGSPDQKAFQPLVCLHAAKLAYALQLYICAMKAIIPVAGVGMRLRPHTYSQPKPLIPVAGKPILGFIIDRLKQAGFKEFIFVIGYLGEKIESFVKEEYPDITSHFILQHTREGLGHAIWLCRDLVQEDEGVFIALGDTIFEADLEAVMQEPVSALGLKKVDDPRDFGVAEVDVEGMITRLVEKPTIPKSNLALVGLYKIREAKSLFEALETNINNSYKTQGEFHLTDALMLLIKTGVKFRGFKVQNWYDCGKKEILLETNAILMKKMGTTKHDQFAYDNTIIIDPVSIAHGCQISNSIVGPNVTLGEGAVVNYSIIRDSIIGNYSNIDDVVLHHSVIGSDATIKGLSQSLSIGDNNEIDLSQSIS